jgi:poly(3-hydroxybutyrate) depolymerase
MTAVMLAAYPDVFAAGAIIAGLICGRIGDPDHDLLCCEGRGSERTDSSARRHTIAKPLRDHAHLGLSGLGLAAVPMGGKGISLEWQLLWA